MIELLRPKESGERLTLNALCVVRKAISKLLVKFISLGNTLGEDLVKVRSARVIARTACGNNLAVFGKSRGDLWL